MLVFISRSSGLEMDLVKEFPFYFKHFPLRRIINDISIGITTARMPFLLLKVLDTRGGG
jgi:hypothetical protein